MIDLNGKVALITGAGGYIGGETAALLARQGAAVAVCDLSENAVRTTVARITAEGGTAKGYRTDVSDSADVNGTVEKVVGDFGRLDISVHAAGGSARLAGADSYARLIEQRDEVIDTVLKVNLYGAIYVARACGAVMVKQGAGGRIISLSSAVGINGAQRLYRVCGGKRRRHVFNEIFGKGTRRLRDYRQCGSSGRRDAVRRDGR